MKIKFFLNLTTWQTSTCVTTRCSLNEYFWFRANDKRYDGKFIEIERKANETKLNFFFLLLKKRAVSLVCAGSFWLVNVLNCTFH